MSVSCPILYSDSGLSTALHLLRPLLTCELRVSFFRDELKSTDAQ